MDPTAIATAATAFLDPYLVKAGGKAAEEIGKKLPEAAGKLWGAVTARFSGRPAADEAAKDLVAKPADEDNQATFRKELKKALEADAAFLGELKRLLEQAQQEAGDRIVNTGSGAVAARGGVAVSQSRATCTGTSPWAGGGERIDGGGRTETILGALRFAKASYQLVLPAPRYCRVQTHEFFRPARYILTPHQGFVASLRETHRRLNVFGSRSAG